MINIIAAILLGLGVIVFLGVVIGIVRLPDFYTRSHAASKGDTLSSALILIGFAVYILHDPSFGTVLVCLKLLFISVFIGLASPTASHALIDAGYEIGLKAWTREDRDINHHVNDLNKGDHE